jgi:hypothetical protein
MNDMLLVMLLPIVIVLLGAIYTVIDRRAEDCKHDYSDWHNFTTEHAYVQQKQCKKCQYVFTYQERKMGHEQSRLDT